MGIEVKIIDSCGTASSGSAVKETRSGILYRKGPGGVPGAGLEKGDVLVSAAFAVGDRIVTANSGTYLALPGLQDRDINNWKINASGGEGASLDGVIVSDGIMLSKQGDNNASVPQAGDIAFAGKIDLGFIQYGIYVSGDANLAASYDQNDLVYRK